MFYKNDFLGLKDIEEIFMFKFTGLPEVIYANYNKALVEAGFVYMILADDEHLYELQCEYLYDWKKYPFSPIQTSYHLIVKKTTDELFTKKFLINPNELLSILSSFMIKKELKKKLIETTKDKQIEI